LITYWYYRFTYMYNSCNTCTCTGVTDVHVSTLELQLFAHLELTHPLLNTWQLNFCLSVCLLLLLIVYYCNYLYYRKPSSGGEPARRAVRVVDHNAVSTCCNLSLWYLEWFELLWFSPWPPVVHCMQTLNQGSHCSWNSWKTPGILKIDINSWKTPWYFY
jgi:hypothetical protein